MENSGSICVFVHQIEVLVDKHGFLNESLHKNTHLVEERGFLNESLHKNIHLVEKSSKSSDRNEDHVLARGLQMNEAG